MSNFAVERLEQSTKDEVATTVKNTHGRQEGSQGSGEKNQGASGRKAGRKGGTEGLNVPFRPG